jgi:hypothetical protein
MRKRRVKGYWSKRTELFPSRADARARAGALRSQEPVAHVVVRSEAGQYRVSYSVAGWYLQELERLGISL